MREECDASRTWTETAEEYKKKKEYFRQEPGDNMQDKYFVLYNKMKNLQETQCFAMQVRKPWGSVYKFIFKLLNYTGTILKSMVCLSELYSEFPLVELAKYMQHTKSMTDFSLSAFLGGLSLSSHLYCWRMDKPGESISD